MPALFCASRRRLAPLPKVAVCTAKMLNFIPRWVYWAFYNPSTAKAVPLPCTQGRLTECRENDKLYTPMGLFWVLQPFSHFLAKMAARAASNPRCLYRGRQCLHPLLGVCAAKIWGFIPRFLTAQKSVCHPERSRTFASGRASKSASRMRRCGIS